MGIPTFVDAVAVAPAAILGLLGVWLGFRRWLVSWPIRWLVPLFGACAAAMLTALHFIVHRELAALIYLSGMVGRAMIALVVFLVTLAGLLMFMSNLRERVMHWTSHGRIGAIERALGALFGIACGLVLVAVPYIVFETMRADGDGDPAWARESLLLPYFRSAGQAVGSALSSYLPAFPDSRANEPAMPPGDSRNIRR